MSSLYKLFVDPQPTSKSQTDPKQIKTFVASHGQASNHAGHKKRQAQKKCFRQSLLGDILMFSMKKKLII
jgi:hypothetical protein